MPSPAHSSPRRSSDPYTGVNIRRVVSLCQLAGTDVDSNYTHSGYGGEGDNDFKFDDIFGSNEYDDDDDADYMKEGDDIEHERTPSLEVEKLGAVIDKLDFNAEVFRGSDDNADSDMVRNIKLQVFSVGIDHVLALLLLRRSSI